MSPGSMPQEKPLRPVQGRYTALVRKWQDGSWKTDDKR